MTSKMYDAVRQALGTSRFVATGQVGGGCINEGEVDHGKGEGDVRRRVQKSEGHEINGDSDGPHSAHSRRRPHGRSRAVLGIPGHGAVRIGPRECLGSSWQNITVKTLNSCQARGMFDGEFESPKATKATGTVMVPTPHIVVDDPAGRAVLCLEYPDMRSLNRPTGMLGKQLAESSRKVI
ncbi:fructosamine-3-kinase-like isoform X2 [Palaemon carinicauda]|uniref:fructosamine-3-kinase-like isoform X2 n=1 Tax=Palaemon carinicauda TaxID=392227 RepID=UPI0035B59F04